MKKSSLPLFRCSQKGSVLIMVLWILMIISFLASEYAAHNRNKAGLAINSMESLKRKAAADSILELFAAGKYDYLVQKRDEYQADPMVWTRFAPGGVELFVKIDKESSKVDLNTGKENIIRTKIRDLYGEMYEDDAENLADALFDWLDADDLIRTHGAEKEYYNEQEPFYNPGNGKFKSMSELFLVKGMNPFCFWGHPETSLGVKVADIDSEGSSLSVEVSEIDLEEDGEQEKSFLESFTIYSKDDKRISILFPGTEGKYYYELFFVEKEKSSFKVVEHLIKVIIPRSDPGS